MIFIIGRWELDYVTLIALIKSAYIVCIITLFTFLLFAIKLANLKLNIIVISIVGIHSNRSLRSVMAMWTYNNYKMLI